MDEIVGFHLAFLSGQTFNLVYDKIRVELITFPSAPAVLSCF